MKVFFKVLFFICVCFHSISFASEISISKDEARNWADTKGQELLSILTEKNPQIKYAKLDQMIFDSVNVNYVASFVIGKYGRLMDEQQKIEYQNLFNRYLLALYKQFQFKSDSLDIDFTIKDVIVHPSFSTVNCRVNLGEQFENLNNHEEPGIVPVTFKLVRNSDKHIQAVDVEISNVSMVLEYRKRFYQMIRDDDEDINWFLETFKNTVAANEAKIYGSL